MPETSLPHVLLIGATGRVGRMLCHHWPKAAPGVGLMATGRAGLPQTTSGVLTAAWSPLDDGPAGLTRLLSESGTAPVAMVVLAGVTPRPGLPDAALADNQRLAEACAQAAQACGIGRMLIASSAAVYGTHREGAAFSEAMPAQPLSAYGRAKLAMEQALDPWRDAGAEICALRIGNVAGADALLGPLTQRQPVAGHVRIDAFADGKGPLRSYIGTMTLARVLAELARCPQPLPEVLNIASPEPVRMTALAQAAGWPYDMVTAPPHALQSVTLDCGRLTRLCSMLTEDSNPAVMVAQWKATWH